MAPRTSSRWGVSRWPLSRSRSCHCVVGWVVGCVVGWVIGPRPLASLPLQLGMSVRLELLAHGRHVEGVEEVAVDVAVEPLAGGVLLRRRGARHRVAGDLEPGLLGVELSVPDLDEAGVVRHHDLEGAILLRPDETSLLGRLPDDVALAVDDPGPAHEVDERTSVLLEQDLLAELEVLD